MFISSGSEEWAEIEGFRSYFISSRGRVKSTRTGRELIRKLYKDKHGYLQVGLSLGKRKSKSFLVHRLVASHFLINPSEKPHVNHKDGVKTNNSKDNLEWVTAKENTLHAYNTGLRNNETLYRNGRVNSRKVSQICVETGEILKIWESASNAYKTSGKYFDKSSVLRCCHLDKDTHKGFRWRFEGSEDLPFSYKKRSDGRPVEVGEYGLYEIFSSAKEVSDRYGVRRNAVYRAINEDRLLLGKYTVDYA